MGSGENPGLDNYIVLVVKAVKAEQIQKFDVVSRRVDRVQNQFRRSVRAQLHILDESVHIVIQKEVVFLSNELPIEVLQRRRSDQKPEVFRVAERLVVVDFVEVDLARVMVIHLKLEAIVHVKRTRVHGVKVVQWNRHLGCNFANFHDL